MRKHDSLVNKHLNNNATAHFLDMQTSLNDARFNQQCKYTN